MSGEHEPEYQPAWLYECEPRYLAGVVLADDEDAAMAAAFDRATNEARAAVMRGKWSLRRLDGAAGDLARSLVELRRRPDAGP